MKEMSTRTQLLRKRILPRNDLAGFEGLPEVFLDFVVGNIVSNFLLHSKLPSQDFLIGESTKLFISTIDCRESRA